MLGAIAGDIIGSTYEFIDMRDYNFELLPSGSHFTDDTVMTIAVAFWVTGLEGEERTKDQLIECMQRLGQAYPYAGYGSSFNCWLWSENPQPYNSWGNGAAMRVSPVGLYAKTLDEALELAKITAEVSHNHPEGIKGAQAVAAAVWMAKHGRSKDEIRDYITEKFHYDLTRTVEDIRRTYQWDVSCQGSVPESIICFLEGNDFENVVRLAVSLGGDSDTMACIAGAIAACIYPIPEWIEEKCKEILATELCGDIQRIEKMLNSSESYVRNLDTDNSRHILKQLESLVSQLRAAEETIYETCEEIQDTVEKLDDDFKNNIHEYVDNYPFAGFEGIYLSIGDVESEIGNLIDEIGDFMDAIGRYGHDD